MSEIDQPGEYYIDRRNGLLYVWPPTEEGNAVLSRSTGIITTDRLSFVTFTGFTMEACRATAVHLGGGTQTRVVGCTFRNLGELAVNGSGHRHEVYGCDVYGTGTRGIALSGGDRNTLVPAQHNIENNHVHHYARRKRTYTPAISVYVGRDYTQRGMVLRYNYWHDLDVVHQGNPHAAAGCSAIPE